MVSIGKYLIKNKETNPEPVVGNTEQTLAAERARRRKGLLSTYMKNYNLGITLSDYLGASPI
jgi:hypothetical protein